MSSGLRSLQMAFWPAGQFGSGLKCDYGWVRRHPHIIWVWSHAISEWVVFGARDKARGALSDRLVGGEVGRQVSVVFPPSLRVLTSAPCKIFLWCTHIVKNFPALISLVSLLLYRLPSSVILPQSPSYLTLLGTQMLCFFTAVMIKGVLFTQFVNAEPCPVSFLTLLGMVWFWASGFLHICHGDDFIHSGTLSLLLKGFPVNLMFWNHYTSFALGLTEELNTASRNVKLGLVAAAIASAWTW